MEEKKEKIKNEKNETNEDGKLIRISKEADEALTGLLRRVNDADEALKITKWNMASYIIEKFCPSFTTDDIKAIYMRTVTEMDLFKGAYKRAMETGVIPDNLRELLFTNAGLTPSPKKIKKTRQQAGSIATIKEPEQA